MNWVITSLVLKFQLDAFVSKYSPDMDDFVSNTLKANFSNFALKFIGD